jgi:sulfonate transport system substrate-binding protein
MTQLSHASADTRVALARRRVLLLAAVSFGLVARPSLGLAASEAAPPLLRIGFQKSAVNLVVLKQQGALEKRFAGTKVQWIEFPAGPQLLEALAVGSLEFGLTGDSPPVFAQAADKDLLYVGAEPPKPLSSAILVKPDAPIRTLADLKGRRVALQKGSSSHYLLVRAVEKARLHWSDIQPVYLPPSDARAAFERGSVDAWVIWDPYYAATEIDIQPRVLATGQELSANASFYLASRPFVQNHPHALAAVLDELTRADAHVQNHRKEAAQLISDFSGLSLATVHRFISRRPRSPVGPLSPATVADQQRVADAFFAQGLIPKAVVVSHIVWQPPHGVLAQSTPARTAP